MLRKIVLSIIIFLLLIQSHSLSFQDNLLRKVIEEKEGENIMISPLSIYQLLGLLSNGASGNTRKEILQVLFPNKEINDNILNDLNSKVKQMILNLESENIIESSPYSNCFGSEEECKIIFTDVNGIFTKKGIELTKQFTQICQNYNTSFFELINAEQINNFCSEKTNGKINNIIDEIDPQTALILINAIYFKGTWLEKFDENETKNRTFLNYDNTRVLAETMYFKYDGQKFYEDEKVQMISLPYLSNKLNFEMIIILPNLKKYSSPLEYLNKEKIELSEIYSKLEPKRNIHLYFPKFNYYFNVELNKILENMGMKSAFSEQNAEFQNLSQNFDTFVKLISQKTFINVNENGTEAAAITMGISYLTSYEPKEYYMYINHSFIYMIVSNKIKDGEDKFLMPFIGIVNKLEGEKDNGNYEWDNNSSDADDKNKDDPPKFINSNYIGNNKTILIIFTYLIFFIYL